jgi:hypothetical protein
MCQKEERMDNITIERFGLDEGSGLADIVAVGDWLNWQIPGTDYHVPIFGDGFYPVWFGFDADDNIYSLVVQFIDVKDAYE